MTARSLLLALFVSGCGYDNSLLDRRKGFGGQHADVALADVPVNGHHVVVVTRSIGSVEGELLAADDVTVYVLDQKDESRVALPWSAIEEVRVMIAPKRPGEPAASIVWTVVGSVSTLTHGIFLVFTLPVWLGAGIPSSVVNGQPIRGRIGSEDDQRRILYQYARYPQGMPTAR